MKTIVPKPLTKKERKWFLIDAKDKILGKLAVSAANILRGRTKVNFTPHLDQGDYLIVINAEKIILSGDKKTNKIYYKPSRHLGHLKKFRAEELLEKNPTKIIELAIKGMIPKNKLRKDVLTRLRIFVGEEHGHSAQTPETIKI